MRKRKSTWLLLLLAAALSLGSRPVHAAGLQDQNTAMSGEVLSTGAASPVIRLTEEPSEEELGRLAVGVANPLTGYFFTDLWGRATSDMDIRMLLHGYNLVRWDGEAGCFAVDPAVVRGVTVLDSAEGDKSYVLTLADDLLYSDGSPITAWDYAFSMLFEISPQIAELGGVPADRSFIAGCEEYLQGSAGVLSGVRVLSDDMLMITLDHEALPHFYELGLLSCLPYPVKVIAPGVAVRDDGEGVYLADEAADSKEASSLYTAELLRGTILDPAGGYMNHPSVVSGPYRLISWDGETVELARNEYYKDYKGYVLEYPDGSGTEGKTARKEIAYIENLSVRFVANEDVVPMLSSGDIDVISKMTRADSIQECIAMTRAQEGDGRSISLQNYPRTGLSYVSFACERPELSQRVRQAMAYCMDRDAITQDITNGLGLRVDSFYGIGQWMYSYTQENSSAPVDPPENADDPAAQEAYEWELEEWASLNLNGLNPYGVNLREAEALLESEDYVLNEETGIREKEASDEEGSGTLALDLTLAYPSENTAIAASLESNWLPYLEEAGIRLTLVPMEFEKLIRLYYGWDDRSEAGVDMFFLASNFDVLFDPLVYFNTQGNNESLTWHYTRLEDSELFRLAEDMRRTQQGANLDYMKKWLAFEERFNEILPALPIYSNIYFDFYTSDLHDYAAAENISWSSRIVDAKLYPDASAQVVDQ